MPFTINHVFTSPVADGTNTQLVRPSNWNETHQGTYVAAGSEISGVFSNANGLSFGLSGGQITGSYTVPSVPAQTAYVFSNSNGVSFGTNGSTVTATVATNYQSQGAYLTTAALSNHSHGNPTLNLTNLSGTTASNSAGFTLSLSAGNYLTTAALSNHSHGNPTLALTNLSGTTASNSAGLTLSLSAAAAGGGGVAISAGGSNFTNGTVSFGNANGFSFITSNGSIVGSYTDAGAGAGISAVVVSAGTTNNAISNFSFADSNNVSFGINGSTITASVVAAAAPDRFFKEVIQGERLTSIVGFSATNVTNRPLLLPFYMEGTGLAANTCRMLMSFGASSNRSLGGTFHAGLYSLANSTQMTLLTSNSFSVSSTASASSASWNGVGWVDFGLGGFTCTAEGRYAVAVQCNPVSANVTWMPVSLYGADNMPVQSRVWTNGATQALSSNSQFVPFWGAYSTTTNALPDTIGLTQINGASSQFQFQYYAALREV